MQAKSKNWICKFCAAIDSRHEGPTVQTRAFLSIIDAAIVEIEKVLRLVTLAKKQNVSTSGISIFKDVKNRKSSQKTNT